MREISSFCRDSAKRSAKPPHRDDHPRWEPCVRHMGLSRRGGSPHSRKLGTLNKNRRDSAPKKIADLAAKTGGKIGARRHELPSLLRPDFFRLCEFLFL